MTAAQKHTTNTYQHHLHTSRNLAPRWHRLVLA
jgi:hypothetical protein